jgi:hypothetical protein
VSRGSRSEKRFTESERRWKQRGHGFREGSAKTRTLCEGKPKGCGTQGPGEELTNTKANWVGVE